MRVVVGRNCDGGNREGRAEKKGVPVTHVVLTPPEPKNERSRWLTASAGFPPCGKRNCQSGKQRAVPFVCFRCDRTGTGLRRAGPEIHADVVYC